MNWFDFVVHTKIICVNVINNRFALNANNYNFLNYLEQV